MDASDADGGGGLRIQDLFKADLEPVERARIEPRTLHAGPGDLVALDPRLNGTYTVVNRLLERGIEILRSTVPVQSRTGCGQPGPSSSKTGPGLRSCSHAAQASWAFP